MPVDTLLFLDDYFHYTKTAVSVSALSFTAGTTTPAGTVTDSGYDPESARDTNLFTAWKAPDNNTFDNALQFDCGSSTYLGNAGIQLYIALAYDAQLSDQLTLSVFNDTGDSPTGTFTQNKGTFNLNTGGPTVDFIQFTMAQKRYWRFLMTNASRGGGTRLPKIFNIAAFPATGTNVAGVYRIDGTDYPGEVSGTGELMQFSRNARMDSPNGAIFLNKNGPVGQEFDLTFEPAAVTFWKDLRTKLANLGVDGRAWYIQYEGLQNAAKADFQMVRCANPNWTSARPYQNVYRTSIRLRTESYGF